MRSVCFIHQIRLCYNFLLVAHFLQRTEITTQRLIPNAPVASEGIGVGIASAHAHATFLIFICLVLLCRPCLPGLISAASAADNVRLRQFYLPGFMRDPAQTLFFCERLNQLLNRASRFLVRVSGWRFRIQCVRSTRDSRPKFKRPERFARSLHGMRRVRLGL